MEQSTVRRYGGIVWEHAAELDDSIIFVETFDNPNDAIRQVVPRCRGGERWAVIDLNSLGIVATGNLRGRRERLAR
jgi:hypothetical protein